MYTTGQQKSEWLEKKIQHEIDLEDRKYREQHNLNPLFVPMLTLSRDGMAFEIKKRRGY